jgi:hypothetical protein
MIIIMIHHIYRSDDAAKYKSATRLGRAVRRMRMVGRWAGALFASAILLGSANAQDGMPEFRAVWGYVTHAMPSLTFDAPDRAAFAGAVAAYCSAVIKSMPTNTPAEDAWVRDEGKTTDFNKQKRLQGSAEYARFMLATTFNDCVGLTRKLLAAQSSGDRRLEAEIFVRLAGAFNYDSVLGFYANNAAMNADWLGLGWIGDQRGLGWLGVVRLVFLQAAIRSIESIPR